MITDTGMAFMFLFIFLASLASLYGIFGNKRSSKEESSEAPVIINGPSEAIELRFTYIVSDAEVDGLDIAQDRAQEYIERELLKSAALEIEYTAHHDGMTSQMIVTGKLRILRGGEK